MVALLATRTSGFSVSSPIAFSRPSTSLHMDSSYETQLRKYNGEEEVATMEAVYAPPETPINGETPVAPQAQVAPPAPAAPQIQSAQPIYNPYMTQQVQAPPPPPPPQQFAPPPPATTPVAGNPPAPEEPESVLPAASVVFLGLPLWLLLSAQVFSGTPPVSPLPAPVAPPAVVQTAPAPIAPVAPVAPVASVAPVTPAAPAQLAMPVIPSTSIPSAANVAGTVVLSQPITKAEVRNLFELWNDALKTGDPAVVAQRYAKEGVLLPTLSDIPRNDVEGIKDYFVHFLEKKPVGKILEGDIFVGNNWAQDAGIYEFTFEDGSKVKARYSFVYVYEDGQWLISHHHSSLMPQEVVRPVKITEQEVRALFGLWNDALKTGDPQKVADRYSQDAVLLPTLSDKARYTNDRIADYFVHFLEKKPQGEILEGNIKIGPNWAQDAGIYEFTFADGSKTKGRYSYVYTYENGKWMISNHHSSIMPEPAVAAMKKAEQMDVVLDKVSAMEKKLATQGVSNTV